MFGKKKQLKKGQLENIDVDLVSLLFDDHKPANRKGVVIKCDDVAYVSRGHSTKLKSDDEGRIFVTVMEPDVEDTQGDITSAVEIQKACERFSEKHATNSRIDINHNGKSTDACFVAENYILKTEDKLHFPDTKIGAWVQVIKFRDTACELWQKVKARKLNGVSLFGVAVTKEEAQSINIDAVKKELQDIIASLKAKNDETMAPAIAELERQIAELDAKSKSDVTASRLLEIEKGFDRLVTTINKAVNTTIKGEPTPPEQEKEVIVGDTKVVIKSEKKDLYKALSGVDSGSKMNVLTDNLGQQFVDTVIDFSPEDVFTDITVAEINKDEQVDIGFLGDFIFRNVKDGNPDKNLVPELAMDVESHILKGTLSLSQDTVEFYKDKKGEAAFGAYVEQKLSQKIRKALKKIIFVGDRTSTDEHIKALDGFVVQMQNNVSTIDGETPTEDFVEIPRAVTTDTKGNIKKEAYTSVLTQCLESFTDDVLNDSDGFVIYASPKTIIRLRAEWGKQKDERLVYEKDKLYFDGIEIKPRHLPTDVFIMGLPQYLILGYRTDVNVKIEHSGADWQWHWFVRARFGTQYVSGGYVKCFAVVEQTQP